jgi:translation initiation factor 1
MDDIKDLRDLKLLFPGMEAFVPGPDEKNQEAETVLLTEKERAQMKLYVSRDKKNRGGKQVTLIEGHTGPPEVREKMFRELKSHCSAGGNLTGEEIMIQGDHVKKVIAWLLKQGYKQVKQKGG